MRGTRWAIAALMVLAAGYCGFAAVGALGNLSADYKDSTDATYIAVGAVYGVIGLGFVVAAIGLLRGWYWRR